MHFSCGGEYRGDMLTVVSGVKKQCKMEIIVAKI
jgi:hypothetical protein